ncbi:uncharacterized protein BDR25DRAFT_76387 [Lindgomyces ingoldianus]|uniref:Uncharacterized protein n=1 Tax=Lindgomyces ingoldianus TaxID=673940 RepID=A0ACB6QHY3_9PLEO|nr:uncharacterized protein BDR25DRAFT_76387 [Lindgomyces ingoldianus]KAF2466578.1 hypothetical protein BDR25DRAFT_76387 [Lindgomyces ingoldianus]
MARVTTFRGHHWPKWSTLTCLTIHLTSYIGLTAVSCLDPVFWVNPFGNGSYDGNNNIPLKVVSITGLVFCVLFLCIYLRISRYLVPQAVALISFALAVAWIALMSYNSQALKDMQMGSGYSFTTIIDDGADLQKFLAAYCMMTFVVVSSVDLILLAVYVLLHSENSTSALQLSSMGENKARTPPNDQVAWSSTLPEARDSPTQYPFTAQELAGQPTQRTALPTSATTTRAENFHNLAELEAGVSANVRKPSARQLVIDGVVFQAVE